MQEISKIAYEQFERADYAHVLEVMEDRRRLPANYDDWARNAEAGVQALEKNGFVVERKLIQLQVFSAWCRERGYRTDARARHKFCNAELQPPLDVNAVPVRSEAKPPFAKNDEPIAKISDSPADNASTEEVSSLSSSKQPGGLLRVIASYFSIFNR